jgi:hypothetical protein
LSSSSDHNDFDERKSTSIKNPTLPNKPVATVKPKVVENKTKVIPPTNPMLKRIPKKATPTKVRVVDIDINKVPVTSTISLDTESNPTKKVISTSLKRLSNGTNEIPQKKAKTTTVVQNIKKKISITSRIIIICLIKTLHMISIKHFS